jgi:hypothetical protein
MQTRAGDVHRNLMGTPGMPAAVAAVRWFLVIVGHTSSLHLAKSIFDALPAEIGGRL